MQPIPTSILSLDVGHKRIGLAGCDPLGITVTPLPAIHRRSFKDDLAIIRKHCEQRAVKGLVVGIPLNEKGLPTKQAKYCKQYGQRASKFLDLPVAWVNEHSSTWAAETKHNLHGDRSGQLDSASAAMLLRQWLREGPELKPVHMAAHRISQLDSDGGS